MPDRQDGRVAHAIFVGVLGMLTAVAPLSIDMYLPAMPGLATYFDAPAATVQYSLSLFFVGLAAGQLIYGPIADRYGRLPVLYIGLCIYVVASILCAMSSSIGMLNIARLVAGFGAAAAPVMSRAIVRDRFSGSQAASVMSFVVMVMAVAPLVAPIVGGVVLRWFEWREIFWLLTVYAASCLGVMWLLLSESHPEERRVRDRGLLAQYVGYLALLRRRRIVLFLACGSLMFGALFSYVAASSFVYIEQFGIEPDRFGFYFGANVLAMLIGTFANGRLVLSFGYRTLLGVAVGNTLVCGMVLMVTSFSGFGGFWGVAVPLFFLLSTVGVAGANTVAGLLDAAPEAAGAASALFGVCQFTAGAIASSCVGMLGGDARAMAVVMSIAAAGSLVAYISLLRWTGVPAPAQG